MVLDVGGVRALVTGGTRGIGRAITMALAASGARVAANYDRKGHRMVDLDVALIANGRTVIAHVLHTAAYRLRQLSGK